MSTSAWTGPKHPAADCEGCPLYDQRYVPNDLDPNSKIAFVGEAPGQQEVKTRVPFSGPSGNLLHRAAKHAGIKGPISQLNVVGCRPPKNRTPTSNEIHRCGKRLDYDLAQLPQLETVVSLGNTATKKLTGMDKVSVARLGPPKEIGNLKIIPTFHPAACLRSGDMYPSLKRDLAKVNEPPSTWAPPVWTLLDDVVDTLDWLDTWLQVSQVMPAVIDIECGIEKDSDWAHPERYQMLCVGIVIDETVVVISEEILLNEQVQQMIAAFVEKHNVICHNAKFDMAGLFPWVGKLIVPYFDTMIASYVLDERPGTQSLEYNAVEFLGSPNWKAELDKYLGEDKNYAAIPRDVLYRYNAYDIWNTWLLWKYFEPLLTPEFRVLHDRLCRVAMMFAHCEMQGSRMDLAYLDKLDEEMLVELDALEEPLHEWVANPRSPKQVKEAFEELGNKLEDTRELTLEVMLRGRVSEATERFVQQLLKYRERQKLHSTYVKGLKKRIYQGRIHTSFNVCGTTTGRTTSKNPNVQNQPRGPLIKSAFLPDEGKVYVQADIKTAELRVVAIESNDPWLLDVLADPERDIHGEVATQLYGPGWSKDQRVRAKAFVFGLSYGREAPSIAREYDMSVREAQRGIDGFFELIPGVVAWKNELIRRVIEDGWDPTNHFGRQRRFHLITRDNRMDVEKQTFAFIPQSTANDITFEAATRLWEEGVDNRILVHDSILACAWPDEAEDLAKRMAEVLTTTAAEIYSDRIPFYIDTEIGPNWGALV
jgi:uracil-DNA glycosylase family 4